MILFTIATNGNAAHLLKVGSKRRRTQAEIEQDNADEKSFREMMEDHKAQMRKLKIQLDEAEEQINSNQNAADILTQLVERGVVR